MRYFSNLTKVTMCALVLSAGVAVRPARADIGGAALLLFLQTTLMEFLQGLLLDTMKGQSRAVLQQQAATTVGVQEALGQVASVGASVTAEQTRVMLENTSKRTFGRIGEVIISGKRVEIGSSAPTACIRTREAPILDAARQRMDAFNTAANQQNANYNSGANTIRERDAMERDAAAGVKAFDLSWISRDQLSVAEATDAEKAIRYSLSPLVVPTVAWNASPRMREIQTNITRSRAESAFAMNVMTRALSLRRPTATGTTGNTVSRSYMGVMNAMAEDGMEDGVQVASIQAKTEAGVLREIALGQKQMTLSLVEVIKALHESNAMAALALARKTQEDQRLLIIEAQKAQAAVNRY